MAEQGLVPVSKPYACRLLARASAPHHPALQRRLPDAPNGWLLAVDLLTVRHAGPRSEGVGRQHDSTRKGVSGGHTFSSALVAPGEDPYLLRCDPYPSARMATQAYPKLTPSEALVNVVGDVITTGYKPAAVLADAQVCSRLTRRSLKPMGRPFVRRFKRKVMIDAQVVKASELAERYPPGRARWYPKLKRYVKRVAVVIEDVGVVDLLLVWQAQGLSLVLDGPGQHAAGGRTGGEGGLAFEVVARRFAPDAITTPGARVVPGPGVRGASTACGAGDRRVLPNAGRTADSPWHDVQGRSVVGG